MTISTTVNATIKVEKHRVQRGETLYTLSDKYHSSIEVIRKLNNMRDDGTLKIGSIINVPRRSKHSSYLLSKMISKHAKSIASKRVRGTHINMASYDDIIFKSTDLHKMFQIGQPRGINTDIIKIAKEKLGDKYVWGAVGQSDTFDCSGFTNYVYRQKGIYIPRTSRNQAKFGKFVSKDNLKKGDLIFFDTSKEHNGNVNHVGIYIGNGKFIHASSAYKKVVITKLDKFYAKRYKGARRPS